MNGLHNLHEHPSNTHVSRFTICVQMTFTCICPNCNYEVAYIESLTIDSHREVAGSSVAGSVGHIVHDHHGIDVKRRAVIEIVGLDRHHLHVVRVCQVSPCYVSVVQAKKGVCHDVARAHDTWCHRIVTWGLREDN